MRLRVVLERHCACARAGGGAGSVGAAVMGCSRRAGEARAIVEHWWHCVGDVDGVLTTCEWTKDAAEFTDTRDRDDSDLIPWGTDKGIEFRFLVFWIKENILLDRYSN